MARLSRAIRAMRRAWSEANTHSRATATTLFVAAGILAAEWYPMW
jgi:hypothetical protein